MLTEEVDFSEELAHREGPRILIVEDDTDVALMLQDHLEYALCAQTIVASRAEHALSADREQPAEVILIDYMLPDVDGPDLIQSLNAREVRPVIMITGHATLGRAINAMRSGAMDMFVKPFDLAVLSEKVASAVEQHRAQQRRVRRLEKVRALSKQVLKDRRGLRRKLDLVCGDIVHAYRDLAVKVSGLTDG